jgi:hypothetical protein
VREGRQAGEAARARRGSVAEGRAEARSNRARVGVGRCRRASGEGGARW